VADSPTTSPPTTRQTGPAAPAEHSAPAGHSARAEHSAPAELPVCDTVPQPARSGTTPTASSAKPTAAKPTAPKPLPPMPTAPKPLAPKPIAPKPIDISAKRAAKSAAATLAAANLAAANLDSPNRATPSSNAAAAGRTGTPGAEALTTNASQRPAAAVTTRSDASAPVPALPEAAVPPSAEAAPRRRLTADSIVHERIVRPDHPIPTVGWRAALYAATGGRINPGIGAAERDWLELLARVRRPMAGARQIAVTSIKGGVGKTTVAACLGLMLAEYRGDGVVAVDADPDAGTLADRLGGRVSVTVRDLLADLGKINSLGQIGEYTSLAGRLRVLAGEQDPAMGEAFRREEYQRVCGALARFFDIVITDSGTGLVHSAMRGTLELADRLIVVGSPTVDGASRASKTLDWLLAHGHERLVEDAVLVLCQDRSSHRVDHVQLHRHFTERCKHVVQIPADPHLYSGGLIDPSLLQPITRDAYVRLAAVVGDGFSRRPEP
jgi:MinD-like ATPase involved in chromosome partitioning or flagellar assembly